jgi:hypothetical protein
MLRRMLPPDVLAELMDENFPNNKHYSTKTYNIGCRGPLCTKAKRDKQRAVKNPTNPYKKGAEEERLEAIIEWLQQGSEKLIA